MRPLVPYNVVGVVGLILDNPRQCSDACYSCGQLDHIMIFCPVKGGSGVTRPTGSVAASSLSVHPHEQGMQPWLEEVEVEVERLAQVGNRIVYMPCQVDRT